MPASFPPSPFSSHLLTQLSPKSIHRCRSGPMSLSRYPRSTVPNKISIIWGIRLSKKVILVPQMEQKLRKFPSLLSKKLKGVFSPSSFNFPKKTLAAARCSPRCAFASSPAFAAFISDAGVGKGRQATFTWSIAVQIQEGRIEALERRQSLQWSVKT